MWIVWIVNSFHVVQEHPVPFGFSPDEVKQLISSFIQTNRVVCTEFTEINPLLDNKGNLMAETAFDILDSCFNS